MSHDLIVLGTGGVGAAALYHAAARGAKVLGVDHFPPGHARGSSHGRTRIIRQAYFEHPNYVPLLRRAYQLWRELEVRSNQSLLHPIGLVQIGPASGHVLRGVRGAAQQHGIAIENFSAAECEKRFSGFRVPEGYEAVFEPGAGYLRVEDCVLAHLDEAVKLGAELHTSVTVRGWRIVGDSVEVETDGGTLRAGKLIITAGAWASSLLADMEIPLTVRRKVQYWYGVRDIHLRADSGCPTFLYELPSDIFYGFPHLDAHGFKLADHTGGAAVADPLNVDRASWPADERRFREFLQRYIPGVEPTPLAHAVCLYTMSPDEHFIVDVHPRHPQVAFAAGLSGHGFKFASVLGEALVDVSLTARTDLPIEFLGCARLTGAS